MRTKKDLTKETRIKLSEEELNYAAGGFSTPVECSKGGAYNVNLHGIM